jgi:hypothetical protein
VIDPVSATIRPHLLDIVRIGNCHHRSPVLHDAASLRRPTAIEAHCRMDSIGFTSSREVPHCSLIVLKELPIHLAIGPAIGALRLTLPRRVTTVDNLL